MLPYLTKQACAPDPIDPSPVSGVVRYQRDRPEDTVPQRR